MTNGEMPTGEMTQPTHNNPPTSSTKPDLTEAVQALEKLNSQELSILRQIVSSLAAPENRLGVQSTDASSGVRSVGVQSVGEAASQGMEVAKKVQSLGFVEFTAGLINGTFDAVVGATIKQMEAYAKLVADLSKSIQQFQVENVSDVQISQYLAERYPDGKGSTSVRPGYTFSEIKADPATGTSGKSPNQQFKDVIEALIVETARLTDRGLNLSWSKLNLDKDKPLAAFPSDNTVPEIRRSIGALLATNMIEQLRLMAEDGMARIVVTDGEIMTKLTFNLTTTEIQERQKQNYNQNINHTQIGGGVGGGWWKVRASTDNTNINVNLMNEESFDQTTMSVNMVGRVRVRFKTKEFKPYILRTPTPTPTPAPAPTPTPIPPQQG